MRLIRDWFHHLFNPHCIECLAEREDNYHRSQCKGCENLMLIIEQKNHIIESLISPNRQINDNSISKTSPGPIHNKYMPWDVKRQMLERRDREAAMKGSKQSVEELEKELGLENASEKLETV